jgi:hypothetical protein
MRNILKDAMKRFTFLNKDVMALTSEPMCDVEGKTFIDEFIMDTPYGIYFEDATDPTWADVLVLKICHWMHAQGTDKCVAVVGVGSAAQATTWTKSMQSAGFQTDIHDRVVVDPPSRRQVKSYWSHANVNNNHHYLVVGYKNRQLLPADSACWGLSSDNNMRSSVITIPPLSGRHKLRNGQGEIFRHSEKHIGWNLEWLSRYFSPTDTIMDMCSGASPPSVST